MTSEPKNSEEGPEKLLDAATQHVSAKLSVYTNLARLTMLEARLFASGSLFIAIVGVVAALVGLVTWLLLLSIVALILLDVGLSVLVILSLLLAVHVVALVCLFMLIKHQLPTLGFTNVRDALNRELDKDAKT